MKEDKEEVSVPDKFWSEWEEADLLERYNKLRVMVKGLLSKDLFELEDALFERTLVTVLNGYFEDLYWYLMEKYKTKE